MPALGSVSSRRESFCTIWSWGYFKTWWKIESPFSLVSTKSREFYRLSRFFHSLIHKMTLLTFVAEFLLIIWMKSDFLSKSELWIGQISCPHCNFLKNYTYMRQRYITLIFDIKAEARKSISPDKQNMFLYALADKTGINWKCRM